VDFEIEYQFVHNGPDGWLSGLVVGHDFSPKLEMDMDSMLWGTSILPIASLASILALATRSIVR